VVLDGSSLTLAQLARVARDQSVKISLDPAALRRAAGCRERIDAVVKDYRAGHAKGAHTPRVYGVTTGFGEFKDIDVAPEQLVELQENILRSHSVGIGGASADAADAANYFPAEVVRAAMVLRINAFLKGVSGVRVELIEYITLVLNAGIVPLVPTRGSVGSSGDLCPLAHTYVLLLGEGRFFCVRGACNALGTPGTAPRLGPGIDLHPAAMLHDTVRRAVQSEQWTGAVEMLGRLERVRQREVASWRERQGSATQRAWSMGEQRPEPIFPVLEKEGLGLTNGAAYSTAMLGLALHDAESLANTADIAAALTLEAVCGRTRALDPRVHAARGMAGQADSAGNIRAALVGSGLTDRTATVQDAYSVRCAPQVHGASRDALSYAKMVVLAEMNAATDNPLFFDGDEACDVVSRRARGDAEQAIGDTRAFSAGNFHGQPVALAADAAAIAIAELANVSERRCQLLLDADHNRNLPANLAALPGVDSGYMMAQYAASALVSENKVLAHPASVDSIPTSANSEDHVAMATHAGHKLRSVLGAAQTVVGIELMIASQGVEWRVGGTDAGRLWHEPDAGAVAGADVAADAKRRLERFARGTDAAGRARVAAGLGAGTRAAYQCVRSKVSPLVRDRVLEGDVLAARTLVASGEVERAVRGAGVAMLDVPAARIGR
jgi:histidine ammonia-lyase